MRFLKSVILLISLLIGTMAYSATNKNDASVREFRHAIAKETARYYTAQGDKRKWNHYRSFVYSSYRVSKMFPMFPAENQYDRILKLYCYGVNESGLRKNYVAVNVPGAKYSNGKVHRFSVDYGWIGLNEINVKHTYQIARVIQAGRSIPKGLIYPQSRVLLSSGKIPSDIKLKKIDLSDAGWARDEWVRLKKTGMNSNKIIYSIKVPFKEETQDDLDSMLVYRVIVEVERYSLGWKYDTWDTKLYEHLKKYIGEKYGWPAE